jgi:DNA-binding NarL/FixJ family response regulator
MDEISDRAPDELLRSTVFSLEAEYRAYRRAAERYHARAEHGFQVALSLLLEARSELDPTAGAAAAAAAGTSSAPQAQHAILTNRETQILKLIAAGNSTKQAAFILGIKFKTAVGHRSQLMKKLRIHDTASLVRFAIRTGLVEP